MREIIDIDQLSEWCVPVRVRGRLIETRNPLREDMSLLDKRLKRGDYDSEHALGEARRQLLDVMIDRILIGEAWELLKRDIDSGGVLPLAPFEKLSIVFQYCIAHASATGGREAAAELVRRGFNLIEDGPPVTNSTSSRSPLPKPDLPPGMVIGGDGSVQPIDAANPGENA